MKPNFIVMMTDQQRADLRRSRGFALDVTPFLDEWAGGGVDFCRAYTPNPTCMPARVSMLTGRYPQSHKVRTNHNVADVLYTEDLLDVLKAEGYRTALCGKNHSHRPDAAFDFSRTNGHLGGPKERDGTEAERCLTAFLAERGSMESHEPSPGGTKAQYPYRNVSDALRFIDETGADTPFFAWISFAEPHNPAQVPEPYYDMFPPDALPPVQTSTDDLSGKGFRFTFLRDALEKVMPAGLDERFARTLSNYYGMLRLIDDQFRRLIAGLADRGLLENTYIVYLSDHGEYAGEYGLIRKGADLPEVLVNIPMIWHGPGVRAIGAEDASCVSLVDILPTICDILGVEPPFGCQGKSILPLLTGMDVPGEYDVAYAQSGYGGLYWTDADGLTMAEEGASRNARNFDALNSWTQSGQVQMARKGDYKIQVDMMGSGYLYNLKDDPMETRNLWDDPASIVQKADMLTALVTASLRACDPLPAPHARYRVKVHPKGFWPNEHVTGDPGVRDMQPLGAYCGSRDETRTP